MLEDGHYMFEVEGLCESDPDAHLFPNAKPPSRVCFSTGPIKVFNCRFFSPIDYKGAFRLTETETDNICTEPDGISTQVQYEPLCILFFLSAMVSVSVNTP